MSVTLSIGFMITVLERRDGIHSIGRYLAVEYVKDNNIISFDTPDGRKHFPVSDVVTISPRVHDSTGMTMTYDSINVENKHVHYPSDEDLANAAIAAEEEVSYDSYVYD